jgi:hypothetical protein
METIKREEIIECGCGCGQSFSRYDNKGRVRIFISGHNGRGIKTAKRISLICDYCGQEYEQLKCKQLYEHHFCSKHCRALWVGVNVAQTVDYKEKKRQISLKNGNIPPLHIGEDHWNWQGGISLQNKTERQSTEYIKWRKAVLAKDNYTCQICGIRGGELSAHHKKEWATHPELRYDVNNGDCLHYDCHMELHGLKKKTA